MSTATNTPAGTGTGLPRRVLGRTGQEVTLFGLGGEGVLRTYGRMEEAVAVIRRALDEGVTYCDTSPAYAESMDYYGAALGERRRQVFLASKTHERTRDASLRLLDDSLRRLRTDHLDLWQLHDLRTMAQVEQIFAKGGAIEALVKARENGRVRFLGLTGHHDPAVLVEAMRRFEFDTLLVALNAADVHRLPFISTALAEAARRGLGVIAMKACGGGKLVGTLTADECLSYVLSLPGVTNVVVGCKTPEEVGQNARAVARFRPLDEDGRRALEARTRARAAEFIAYKGP